MAISEDDLLRDLMTTFQAEAVEHVQALNQALLQLERQPEGVRRHELLQTAFRAAHSLKGAARAVSLNEIEALSHAMENVLQKARDARLSLTPTVCDILYDVLDAIGGRLNGQQSDIAPLMQRLDSAAADSGFVEATPPMAIPLPAPTPAAVAEPVSVPATAPVQAVVHEPAPESEAVISGTPSDETIRVAVNKLDELMAQAGELVVSKISAAQHLSDMQAIRYEMGRWPKHWREIKTLLPRINGDAARQLSDILTRHYDHLQLMAKQINALDQSISRDTLRLEIVTNRLQDEVRRVRMVPFSVLELGLQRAVRDVARSEEKQIQLIIEGGDVELDKKILESLKDPLMHLLRNAASHGIEKPDDRLKVGKPAEGLIMLSVQQRGGEARITVRDNGRGFDLDALRKASAQNGGPLLDEHAAKEEVLAVAFLPGVTTAKHITAIAGRGVGLDVVRESLGALQGRILLDSDAGHGSVFTLIVPMSLTMTRGLLVRVGTERYVLPLLSVEKIVRLDTRFTIEGRLMITVDGVPLPLLPLANLLRRPIMPDQGVAEPLAVVMGVAEQRLALLVDDVLTEQELAVKPLGKPLVRVPNVAGTALLGSGEPVIILNAADLVKSARDTRLGAHTIISTNKEDEEVDASASILVVDDSITTRTLEKNILEAAGYQVITATDGMEAMKRLKDTPFNLVVTDIEMPNMDGISLTRQIRENSEFARLPIILVTSLESREDRERGLVAGADAYIVKRGFDQKELLATIQQLL